MRDALRAALGGEGKQDAEVLNLAAAYYWNASIYMHEARKGDPRPGLKRARRPAKQAQQRDPGDDGRQSRSQVITHAHLLLSPFGARDDVTRIQPVIGDAEVYEPGSVGVQAGVMFPLSFFDLTVTDIELGYHPGAQSFFAHVATSIPFWL